MPNGTTTANQWLDTLGDKIMYPLIYQNLGGTESIYADQTILLASDDTLTGPTAVRWYQFNMTGNTIPATPAQQQDWNNGADGLFRWMPSINVDWQGNVAIGYSTSSTTLNPGIRYAGRLAGDPPNNMARAKRPSLRLADIRPAPVVAGETIARCSSIRLTVVRSGM